MTFSSNFILMLISAVFLTLPLWFNFFRSALGRTIYYHGVYFPFPGFFLALEPLSLWPFESWPPAFYTSQSPWPKILALPLRGSNTESTLPYESRPLCIIVSHKLDWLLSKQDTTRAWYQPLWIFSYISNSACTQLCMYYRLAAWPYHTWQKAITSSESSVFSCSRAKLELYCGAYCN